MSISEELVIKVNILINQLNDPNVRVSLFEYGGPSVILCGPRAYLSCACLGVAVYSPLPSSITEGTQPDDPQEAGFDTPSPLPAQPLQPPPLHHGDDAAEQQLQQPFQFGQQPAQPNFDDPDPVAPAVQQLLELAVGQPLPLPQQVGTLTGFISFFQRIFSRVEAVDDARNQVKRTLGQTQDLEHHWHTFCRCLDLLPQAVPGTPNRLSGAHLQLATVTCGTGRSRGIPLVAQARNGPARKAAFRYSPGSSSGHHNK